MPKTSKTIDLIVRRGALRRFHKLSKKTADLPVNVMWDRRTGERRSTSNGNEQDRRRTERRQMPPFTWDLSDFVIATPAPRTKKKSR